MRCRHCPHSLSTKATESQERGELSGLDESIGSRELTVELDQIFIEVVLDGGVGDVIGSRELTVELDQIFSEVVLDGGVGDVP